MSFDKKASNIKTCQLLQHPIAPPRKFMVAKDLLPGGLSLGMAKPPTQQETAFYLISFLDIVPADPSSHLAKTGRQNPPPTGKSSGLLDSAANNKYCFLDWCSPKTTMEKLGTACVATKSYLISTHLSLPDLSNDS